MINITDWVAVIPQADKTIAYVGEHESVAREFFLADLAYRDFDLSTVTHAEPPRAIQKAQQSTTETLNAEGATVATSSNVNKESYTQQTVTVDCRAKTDIAPLAKLIEADGIRLVWTVLAQHTQLPGLLRATLRAVGPNGEVKKTAMMLFTVAPSVAASPASPIPLSEHEQMERAMVLALENAADETFAAFAEKVEETEGELRLYVDEKTCSANDTTFGTVKVVKRNADAQKTTGINMRADGVIKVVGASKEVIDERFSDSCPIVPSNLDYAVKSVGDGYYAKAEDVGDVEAALDSILALQEALIGGGAE